LQQPERIHDRVCVRAIDHLVDTRWFGLPSCVMGSNRGAPRDNTLRDASKWTAKN
jgi:hypothetical protein